MSPRPARVCSVIDCGHSHFSKGFCRAHFYAFVEKPQKERAKRQAAERHPSHRVNKVALRVVSGDAS